MNAIRLFAALLVLGLGGCANYPMGSLKTDLLPAEDVAAPEAGTSGARPPSAPGQN